MRVLYTQWFKSMQLNSVLHAQNNYAFRQALFNTYKLTFENMMQFEIYSFDSSI